MVNEVVSKIAGSVSCGRACGTRVADCCSCVATDASPPIFSSQDGEKLQEFMEPEVGPGRGAAAEVPCAGPKQPWQDAKTELAAPPLPRSS